MTAATGGGGAVVDPATAALRRLMRDGGDSAARQRLLTSLLGRKVVAATWPGAAEAVRTLTNSSGEQAMPLFTGMDALQASATRFGWVNPDGSLSFRELPAREALRSALQNQVHFVVIDIGAEHATEFARAEIERVLKPEPNRAGHAAVGAGAVPKRTRALHDIDTPFGVERPTNRTAMPPTERTAAVPARVAPAREAAAVARGGELHELAPRAAAPAVARTRRVEQTVPFDESVMQATAAPQRTTDVGIAPPHASTVPPAPMHKLASEPPLISLPPLPDSLAPEPAVVAAPAPNPKPPPPPAPAAARDLRGKPTQTEIAAVKPAPRTSADASQNHAAPSATHEAMNAATGIEPAASQQADSFAAPKVPLADAVLSQLSDVLRKYPEVEWACEVSDGSPTPVIGLRIAPAFMTRADEISAALAKVASSGGNALNVTVLTDRDRMREARAEGNAFFPWRRRGKKA